MKRPAQGSHDRSLPIHKESEGQKIYLWRLFQLEEAGVPRGIAKKIAESDFDLDKARKMLAGGCSPELLLDIAT